MLDIKKLRKVSRKLEKALCELEALISPDNDDEFSKLVFDLSVI